MNDGEYMLARIKARCHEDGDCWIWDGAANNRGPVLGHDGKELSVRRTAWESHNEAPFPAGKLACRCEISKLCVNPKHITPRARGEITKMVMAAKPALKKYAERALGHRNRATAPKVSDEAVVDIRSSSEHWSVLVARHGCSRGYVLMLRNNRFRRDLSNPFVGLGARQGAGA